MAVFSFVGNNKIKKVIFKMFLPIHKNLIKKWKPVSPSNGKKKKKSGFGNFSYTRRFLQNI